MSNSFFDDRASGFAGSGLRILCWKVVTDLLLDLQRESARN